MYLPLHGRSRSCCCCYCCYYFCNVSHSILLDQYINISSVTWTFLVFPASQHSIVLLNANCAIYNLYQNSAVERSIISCIL
ncbi:hypothetical protein L228DRAFT_49456 [Xylona heveae TC161]|uniref:Uncharacterized protein n=1 Tax=Xylona heveae (strain CBS 132557 / TC161) TaxID=1328760 RepID=A0A164ZLK1_XYLHT|nr:hypothetical protein L228DRAFT_49456 [Xylona heveae TC161]KZF19249.1 hypothetical protein L228DRAFT_49456 [Xylona heveae TC161]